MTLHWECTFGEDRVKEVAEKDFAGRIEIIAQNIKTADFGDPVFKPYVMRAVNGVKIAIIGQAMPYTPIAHPRYFVPEWTFGIQDDNMQKTVDAARGEGAQAVVVLSHNGMDVDLKMASRVSGIDAILGGHTHDGVPTPQHRRQCRRQDHCDERRHRRQIHRRARFRRQRRPCRRLPLSASSGLCQSARRRMRKWRR